MKILMICEFYDPKLQFQENLLTKYLVKHGHEVRVLTSIYSSVFDYYSGGPAVSDRPGVSEDQGATIVRLPYKYNILNKLRPYRGVARQLDDFRPDLVYLHDIVPNTREIARYLRRNPAARLILDIHMDFFNSGRKGWLSLRVLHGVIRKHFLDIVRPRIAKIFPVVPESLRFMREVYGIRDDEMELLPLAPDTDLIAEVRAGLDREAARAQLGFGPDDVVIFTGGKLARRKRLELLLAAMARPGMEATKLVVVGEFPPGDEAYRDELTALAAPLGERVRWAGWQNARGCFGHMLVSDLAVFPASQSVMWQQAIACGLPLVIGDSGNQDPSYLNGCDNAVILAPDRLTAADLGDAVAALIASPGRRAAMAAGAAHFTSELLDWNSLVARITRFNAG